ncbi:TPA: omptin family outer membrane protease, partial [Enterobacter cloacae]|nr:omptin family outer membrane protease [Enterobacter cloacae]
GTAQAIPDFSPESLSVSASAGMLSGKSDEMVYDEVTGRKISQLDWKIKNVAILKGDISWDAYSFLTLNARGWTSLASGSGHMDDYDWMNAKQSSWTDHSSHPATNVNYANEYDLNVKGWIFQGDNYKAGVTAGYQETRFSWTATGGSYNYDNGTNTGNFPAGERGIGYSQRFSMPYIGLAGQYRFNDFEFNALFKFSDWVRAHDNDEHYMRDLTFREKTSDSRYYGASVDAGYYVTPNAKVFAEFTYSSYEEGKGGTQIIDTNTGESGSIGGDAAGISNRNYTITAGLQYRF